MVNILEYNIGVVVEDLNRYCFGGFYFIYFYDKFYDGCYEIVYKFGFGVFFIVWFVWDNQYVKGFVVVFSDWKFDFFWLLIEVLGSSGM